MSSDEALLAIDGKVATITLNRPDKLNAVNSEVRRSLKAHFLALEANREVQVIILGGTGRSFCAGNDIHQTRSPDMANEYYELYSAIRRSTKAVITRIQGHCAGAGLQMALLTDLRIAADSAKIGMVEFNIGLPVLIGSGLLRVVCGEAAMRRIVMYSDFIGGSEAVRLNLATESVPDDQLDTRVAAIAAGLAARGEATIRITKECWNHFSEAEFEAVMAYGRDIRSRNAEASTTVLPDHLKR